MCRLPKNCFICSTTRKNSHKHFFTFHLVPSTFYLLFILMKQKIFLIIGILLLSFFGVSIYNEFMANHTYYQGMLASWTNRKLVIRAIIAVSIPVMYIVRSKIFSVKKFFMYIMPIAIAVFTTAFVVVKDSII